LLRQSSSLLLLRLQLGHQPLEVLPVAEGAEVLIAGGVLVLELRVVLDRSRGHRPDAGEVIERGATHVFRGGAGGPAPRAAAPAGPRLGMPRARSSAASLDCARGRGAAGRSRPGATGPLPPQQGGARRFVSARGGCPWGTETKRHNLLLLKTFCL